MNPKDDVIMLIYNIIISQFDSFCVSMSSFM